MKKFKTKYIYKIIGYKVSASEKVKRRLLEFGFTKGERFVVSYKSLFGGSVIVEIRGYLLSLRTKFLSYLEVE